MGSSNGHADRSAYALVIATSQYDDPRLSPLKAPVRDAKELVRVLADPAIGGFEAQSLVNEPGQALREKIEEFLSGRGREDLVILYFSCHGIRDPAGRLCFAATDTKAHLLGSSTISADFVYDQIDGCRAQRILLLLDCCYSGAYLKGRRPRALSRINIGLHEGRGRAVITSCTSVEHSFEVESDQTVGTPEPSVFTAAIVEGLRSGEADRDHDGQVSLDDLYSYVLDKVRSETPHQTPEKKWGDIRGDFIIARSPLPPRNRQELAAGQSTPGQNQVRTPWVARRRVLSLIIVPLLVLAALGGLFLQSTLSGNAAVGQVQRLAAVISDITMLEQRLENERDQITYYIALGTSGGRAESMANRRSVAARSNLAKVQKLYEITGRSASRVTSELRKIGTGYSPQIRQQAASVLGTLGNLGLLREASTTTDTPAQAVVQEYAQVISVLLTFEDDIAQEVDDTQFTHSAQILSLVSQIEEELSEQRSIVGVALLERQMAAISIATLNALISGQQSNIQAFEGIANASERRLWANDMNGSASSQVNSEEANVLATAQGNNGSLESSPESVHAWYGVASEEIDDVARVSNSLASQEISRTNGLVKNTVAPELAVGILGFLLVILTAAFVRPSRVEAALRWFGHRKTNAGRHSAMTQRPGQDR